MACESAKPNPMPNFRTLDLNLLRLFDELMAERNLTRAADNLIAAARKRPELANVISTFRASVPTYSIDMDTDKLQTMGISLTDAYNTLQTFLGGLYVNDFNQFGRTYQVVAQADARRASAAAGAARVSGDGRSVAVVSPVSGRVTNAGANLGQFVAAETELFRVAEQILHNRFGYYTPGGGFFLWLDVGDGEEATRKLWGEAHVKVLPGAYCCRETDGINTAQRYIRVALVHDEQTTREALTRLAQVL